MRVLVTGGPILDGDLKIVDAIEHPFRECLQDTIDDLLELTSLHG